VLLKKALLRKKGLRSPTSLIGEKRGVSHALIKKDDRWVHSCAISSGVCGG
jgi:hypothetical protein